LGRRRGATGLLSPACPEPPKGAQWRFVVFASEWGFIELSRFGNAPVALPPGLWRFHSACILHRGKFYFLHPEDLAFTVKEQEKTAFPEWKPAVPEKEGAR
jgi:hypothetical protein